MAPDATHILGRILLSFGIILVVVGLILLFVPRWPGILGRLPGDLSWERGNLRVYLPLGTSLLLSLILTAIVSLISWLRR